MVEERVFVFENLDCKENFLKDRVETSYRGLVALVFAAEQLGIWYRVSELVFSGEIERFMKVKGETIEMYDANENLLASSNVQGGLQ